MEQAPDAPTCIYKHVQMGTSCVKRSPSDPLTGCKKGVWDQIFSVWQSGQYRAPVIKPLPVKHPAIIDEFSPGRAELSLGPDRQERGIWAWNRCSRAPVNLREKTNLCAFWLRNKDQGTRSLLALIRWTCRRLAVSKLSWSCVSTRHPCLLAYKCRVSLLYWPSDTH